MRVVPGRAISPGRLLAALLAFVVVSALGGVLAAGLVLPAVGAVGTASQASVQMFEELPSELEVPEPSQSSQILFSDGSVMATIYADDRVVVPLDEISQPMRDAVIAIEDRRFYEHRGVDLEAIARAAVNNASGGALQGGSTLTMQFIKNALIEQGRVTGDTELIAQAQDESYERKLEEARMAIALEQRMSKDEILAGYLNVSQFGRSQYGVEAAARYYFNTSAAELDIAQAAMLAGITQSPARHDPEPEENRQQARDRRDVVLGTMYRQGYITEAEYQEALETSVGEMLDITPTPNGCGAAGDAAYFCEYVVDELLEAEEWGESLQERRQALYRGGLVIHTTLDPGRQQAAVDAVNGNLPAQDHSGIRMALSSVEPGTGNIEAMAQNTAYGSPSPEIPAATSVNLNVGRNRGGGAGFQSGSSFKTFVLVEWLNQGRSLNEQVVSDRDSYPRESWDMACGNYADDYQPSNMEGAAGDMMSVQEAIRRSVNLTFVEMANQMDLCDVVDTAEQMGLETGNGDPLTPNPAAVLGSNTITPLSQAVAFATLANRGEACAPRALTTIEDRSGQEIATFDTDCERVLDEAVADAANYALQDVVSDLPGATGTGAILPGDRPAAGKTGTANNASAAWFVGHTPQLSTAVWMGYQEGTRSMFNTYVAGQYYPFIYGSHIPAPTWRDYMAPVLEDQPQVGFPTPGDREVYGEQISISSVTGQSVSAATQTLEDAGFTVQMGPAVSSSVPAGLVASTSPRGGATAQPGSTVTLHPGQEPAPENDGEDGEDQDDGTQ